MINIPKGTKDVLPNESFKWQHVRKVVNHLANIYNLKEIIPPVFEHTELFLRGVGESSDIVNKEMYTFLDRGNRSLTLRPEGTASVVRSFIENGMNSLAMPVKLFYFVPNFRYEKPQSGRYRQHTQFGVEMFGGQSHVSEAETLLIMNSFYQKLSIKPTFVINTIGCNDDRERFKIELKNFVEPNLNSFCADCKRRYHQNPLRMLDCKSESCNKLLEKAPTLQGFLCNDCQQSFNNLQQLLTELKIDFKINSKLVRGFDYYTGLVFEVMVPGVDYALGAGGRYDTLVEQLGGAAVPVVGFGIGIERVLLYLENKADIFEQNTLKVYITSATDNLAFIVNFAECLRKENISCEYDLVGRSVKAQFKYANKINAETVLVIGDEEISSQMFTLKDMKTGEQMQLTKEQLIKKLK